MVFVVVVVVLQYIYLHHTCVLKSEFGHVWLLTTGLFTEIAVCNFLRGWRSYGPKPFFIFILSIVCVYTFFCSFLSAHCALDLGSDQAP